MSPIARFVRRGLDDVDRRLGAISSPRSVDGDWIVRTIEAGVVFGAANHLLDRARSATDSSAVVGISRSIIASWTGVDRSARRLATGAILLVAVAVHLGLRVWQGPDPGWLWLILPGLTATLGVVIILASGAIRTGNSRT